MKFGDLIKSIPAPENEEAEEPFLFMPVDEEDVFASIEEMEEFVDSQLKKYPEDCSSETRPTHKPMTIH